MTVPAVTIPQNAIATFCRQWKVQELALFGSALREDFRPDSDVDVLVSFLPEAQWSLFDIVRMQLQLQTLFGRAVDLVERTAIEQSENYIRRKSILSHLEVIYAAR
ncbi:MAG: nucleotidyltransferase family protein [Anaerolineae bacterium]